MDDLEKYNSYYQKEILPELNEFEKSRKDSLFRLRRAKLFFGLMIVIYIVVIFYFYKNTLQNIRFTRYYIFNEQYNYIIIFSIIMMLIMSLILYRIKTISKSFNYLAAANLYSKIVKFYPGLTYLPFESMDSQLIIESNLFKVSNTLETNDYIKGVYKDLNIEISSIYLANLTQRYVDNQLVTNVEELFRGLFFISNLKKKFSSETYVLPNKLIKLFTGLPLKMNRVVLEDPNFEKSFDVYSNSQTEARYLLTPSFMERLLKLNNLRQLHCCFMNGKIFIALKQEDELFPEVSLYQELNYDKFKQIIEDLQIIFEIIDTLKLDMNIGL